MWEQLHSHANGDIAYSTHNGVSTSETIKNSESRGVACLDRVELGEPPSNQSVKKSTENKVRFL